MSGPRWLRVIGRWTLWTLRALFVRCPGCGCSPKHAPAAKDTYSYWCVECWFELTTGRRWQ